MPIPFSASAKRSISAARGFTLPEILVALAVVGILSALLFPMFGRARESGRQGHCAGNLQNIYLATRQYREDFQGYPPSLEVLLPAGSVVVATSGGDVPLQSEGDGEASLNLTDPITKGGGSTTNGVLPESKDIAIETVQIPSLSYLQTLDEVVCPSDKIQLNGFSSSYGAKIGSVWNFHGYDRLGFQSELIPGARLLVDPSRPYDARRNPAKYALANRFAPPGTIVSHCIFHRAAGSGLKNPYALSTQADAGAGNGASDIVLRLDGTAKTRDVSGFKGTRDDGADSKWQIQTF